LTCRKGRGWRIFEGRGGEGRREKV